MADILHELVIAASPGLVYQAVTEQDGLASWWTSHTKAQPKVDTISEFGFMGGQFIMQMRVAKLEPVTKVQWIVLQSAPDWAGTYITWDLTPVEKTTKVLFGHRDWISTDGSYASVNYSWGHFLSSLKAYLETGIGTPDAT
jgi:uncharacterized protein YndB with AHSA1/START domain